MSEHASASCDPALLTCHLRMEILGGRAPLKPTRWQDRGWGPHIMGELPHCTVLEAIKALVLLLSEGSRCENMESVSTEKAPLPGLPALHAFQTAGGWAGQAAAEWGVLALPG